MNITDTNQATDKEIYKKILIREWRTSGGKKASKDC